MIKLHKPFTRAGYVDNKKVN